MQKQPIGDETVPQAQISTKTTLARVLNDLLGKRGNTDVNMPMEFADRQASGKSSVNVDYSDEEIEKENDNDDETEKTMEEDTIGAKNSSQGFEWTPID